jgi:hypothetical protein
MAYNVKFLKGTQTAYDALTTKDPNTFYYTDSTNLYLGDIKLSNGSDVATALAKIGTANTDISNLKTAVGTLSSLNTTEKSNLVAAINEVLSKVNADATSAAVTVEEDSNSAYAKVYNVKQGGTTVGTINIPKDMVVKSGTVEVNPTGQDAGTYIVLTLANASSDKIYVNVGSLVDVYTAQASAAQVQLVVNSSTREISASIVAGSISSTELASDSVTTAKIANSNVTKAKLDSSVQTSLGKADSALQSSSITTGSTNGTIAVSGTDVSVKGLGSAAYTASTAYDKSGAASAVLGTSTDASTAATVYGAKAYAKSYADGLAGNYATAAQGAKADSAVQSIATGTSNGTISVDGTDVSVKGLGSAAYETVGSANGNVPVNGSALGTTANVPVVTNTSGQLIPHASGALGTAAFAASSSFATAAQGTKADTALQSSSITAGTSNGTIAVSGTDVAVTGLGSAAYTASSAYATAAQGSKADSSVQSVSLASGTNNGTVKLTVNGTATDNIAVKGLASAAYKTAGAASGNVPLNGAALSKTANTPVVTDASGNLVSHASGALGTAAFTASSAYDASGAANTALTNAKAYTDSLLTWGTI